MSKSANLYARIEPDVKEQAESILASLGITASNAINMFYKQIILQRGLPFDVKLPSAKVVDISELTEEQLGEELEKGYTDVKMGRAEDVDTVFDNIRREYGIWRFQCVMPVDNYIVFYIPNGETHTVSVIRVMYGGRDIDTQLNKYTKLS